jgi:hypothetical protein
VLASLFPIEKGHEVAAGTTETDDGFIDAAWEEKTWMIMIVKKLMR